MKLLQTSMKTGLAFALLTMGLASAQTPVTVTNPTNTPVPVKDQDQPAKHRVTLYANLLATGTSFGSSMRDLETGAVFQVPSGKRLVVESFSTNAESIAGNKIRFYLELYNTPNPNPTIPSFFLPVNDELLGVSNGQVKQGFEGMSLMRWYVDEGEILYTGWERKGPDTQVVGCTVVTGYLVDMPPPGISPQ